jgi:hypothetical protein
MTELTPNPIKLVVKTKKKIKHLIVKRKKEIKHLKQ